MTLPAYFGRGVVEIRTVGVVGLGRPEFVANRTPAVVAVRWPAETESLTLVERVPSGVMGERARSDATGPREGR